MLNEAGEWLNLNGNISGCHLDMLIFNLRKPDLLGHGLLSMAPVWYEHSWRAGYLLRPAPQVPKVSA